MLFLSIPFKQIEWIGIELPCFYSSTANRESNYDRLSSRKNHYGEMDYGSMSDCSEGDLCFSFRFLSNKSNGLVIILALNHMIVSV